MPYKVMSVLAQALRMALRVLKCPSHNLDLVLKCLHRIILEALKCLHRNILEDLKCLNRNK